MDNGGVVSTITKKCTLVILLPGSAINKERSKIQEIVVNTLSFKKKKKQDVMKI